MPGRQIYGLGEADVAQFLVLELVDGESLDKRIARGPIPIDAALGIAAQLIDALEAAHDTAIVHRDLEPANIALTRGGQVKCWTSGSRRLSRRPRDRRPRTARRRSRRRP